MNVIRGVAINGRPCVWLWHPKHGLTRDGLSYLAWAMTPGGR